MQGVKPALIIEAGIPETDNIITVFIKFHLQTIRIFRAACKTIVALALKSDIWISDLLHLFSSLETLSVFSNLELIKNVLNRTVHEYRKVIHCIVDTMVGHTRLRLIVSTDLS